MQEERAAFEKVKVRKSTPAAYEEVTLQSFRCDPKWPVCLFDFTFKNKTPEFLCYKTGPDSFDQLIVANHFSKPSDENKEEIIKP